MLASRSKNPGHAGLSMRVRVPHISPGSAAPEQPSGLDCSLKRLTKSCLCRTIKQKSSSGFLFCYCSLLYLRQITVHKGDGDLGVVLRGQQPVVVETVIPNSAAERAGVIKGDCILKMNDHSVV